jgi:hypothetical protein
VLASLLPGLRDLRAPLVAGTLLLFSVALFLTDSLDDASSASGRSNGLNDLVAWIGRPGLLAATLLASYLVGSILVGATRWVIRKLNYRSIGVRCYRLHKVAVEEIPTTSELEPGAATAVAIDVVRRRGRRRLLDLFFVFNRDSLISALALMLREASPGDVTALRNSDSSSLVEVLSETYRDGGRRLRLVSGDLHADYDRLQSEAELRDAMISCVPVAVLAVLLNLSLSTTTEIAIGLVTAALVATLFLQARQLDRGASSLLLGALTDGAFIVPALERRKAAAQS